MPISRTGREELCIAKILRSIEPRHRLAALVAELAREVLRLEEDNKQLRAAIHIYRSLPPARRRPRAGGNTRAAQTS